MLGVAVDDMLKFDKQVVNTCRKVSQQIAVLKHMRNILPNDIRKNIYMPLIVPHFDCCAQTWHFCNNSSAEKLEKENERAVRFVFWDKHSTYKEFLKLLGRRTQMGQRMSKILCSVFKPVNNKRKPEWVNLITRKNICLERKGHFAKAQHNPLWQQIMAVSGAQDLKQLACCRESVVRF